MGNQLKKFGKAPLGDKIFIILIYILLAAIMLVVFLPLVYIVSASFSDPQAVISNEVWFLPVRPTLRGYQAVFKNRNILTGFANSFYYMIVGTLVNIVMTVMCAYPLSRKEFTARNKVAMIFVFTMYFSGGLIPSYLLINNWLHLSNTIFALILPGAMSAYTVIIMRNFFESIPDSLEESAKLDGANDVTILFRIMVPLSKASIATIALWSIVYHWNEWFNCMLYMKDEDKYVLQYVLRKILLDGQTQDINMATNVVVNTETMKMATLVVSILPIIMLYPFLQKYFAKGVMVGSVKG